MPPLRCRHVSAIRYFNRHTGQLETEQVYGEGFLRFSYGNPLGAAAAARYGQTRRFFSAGTAGGWTTRRPPRRSRRSSRLRARPRGVRRSRRSASAVSTSSSTASSSPPPGRSTGRRTRSFPPTAATSASKASAIDGVFVKGQQFDLGQLLGDDSLAARFADGSLILSRLCPVDYHRFHFPAAGTPGETRLINGPLFSVSPIALRTRLAYLWDNKRTITRLRNGRPRHRAAHRDRRHLRRLASARPSPPASR